jgi:lysine decarboxylase
MGPVTQPHDERAAGAPWLADAPLFAAWRRFAESDVAPFTIPGHKRRASTLDPALARLLDADVPLYGGADTVKLSAGVLADAERRAAALWGADTCRFSAAGSTHANQVLCLAVGRPGDTVLVGRNAHRSVLSGLVLAGLRPVWLPISVDPRTTAPLGVATADVARALATHPEAVALLLTEPAYRGALSDLPAAVRLAHDRGIPVLVDQAWGPHLGMTEGYPRHALQCGADAMVTSAHKVLPAFSQASLVLARHERLAPDRVDRAFEATHTTSPSAAILASIDAARALLGSPTGREVLERLANDVAAARARLRAEGLTVPGPEDHPAGRFDPAKLVVEFGDADDGLAVEAALLARGIPVEMADRGTLVAQIGLTDDATTLDRLVTGVLAAVAEPVRRGDGGQQSPPAALGTVGGSGPTPQERIFPPQRSSPREAFFAHCEAVPRESAIGRTCAEVVAPYPPGVPVLVPGEEVTPQTLAALDAHVEAGTRIAYAADPTLTTLLVCRAHAARP